MDILFDQENIRSDVKDPEESARIAHFTIEDAHMMIAWSPECQYFKWRSAIKFAILALSSGSLTSERMFS